MDTKQGWKIARTIILIAITVAIAGWGWRVYSNRDQSPSRTQASTRGESVIRLTTDWSEPILVQSWQKFNCEVRGYAEEWHVRDADNPARIYIQGNGQYLDTSKDPIRRFQFRLSPGKRNDGNVFLIYSLH